MGEPPCFAVLTADSILGPYEMVNPKVNPCGLEVGDFDLQVDPDTEKGYLISQKPHTCIYVAELNEDYTDAAGTFPAHGAAPGTGSTRTFYPQRPALSHYLRYNRILL